LTLPQLGEALTRDPAYRHLKPVFDDGAGTLIKPLTWQGDMSLGPRRDGQRTFQLLEANPRWSGIPDLEDAGPRAITAYLRTYGPATFDHVHHWLGDNLGAGRRRLDRWLSDLADRLVAVDVEGTTAYVVEEDAESLTAARPSTAVRFLPGHDQWLMGPGTKDSVVTPAALREAMTRKANPVIVGGVVRGIWTLKKDEITVARLDGKQQSHEAIEEEAQRLAAFLGEGMRLTVLT
jgi:hypothetical protein